MAKSKSKLRARVRGKTGPFGKFIMGIGKAIRSGGALIPFREQKMPRFRQVSAPAGLHRGPIVVAPHAVGSVKVVNNSGREIVHSELIKTINGSVAFGYDAFNLNPGLPSAFPWLSTTAAEFQMYRFNRLSYRFETTSGGDTKGQVIIVPDYSLRDDPPGTEQAACNAQGAVSSNPWQNFAMHCDPRAMLGCTTRKFIRQGVNGEDSQLCDSGRVYVCTVGMADASAVGRLWVDYSVSLILPQMPQVLPHSALYQMLTVNNDTTMVRDGNWQYLDLISQTTQHYSQDLAAYPHRLTFRRGIYRISGQVQVNLSGTGLGVLNIEFTCNSETEGKVGPPLNIV